MHGLNLSATGLTEEDKSYSESICASRLLLLQPAVIAPSHLPVELTSVSPRHYCKVSRAIICYFSYKSGLTILISIVQAADWPFHQDCRNLSYNHPVVLFWFSTLTDIMTYYQVLDQRLRTKLE